MTKCKTVKSNIHKILNNKTKTFLKTLKSKWKMSCIVFVFMVYVTHAVKDLL